MSESKSTTAYYDNDFDIVEWTAYCEENYTLPEIVGASTTGNQTGQWNDFYTSHSGGNFFKSRKYLCQEFKKWFDNARIVLEVGCGYGCSIIPLMDSYPDIFFVGSDYSQHALSIMSKNPKFDSSRARILLWDVCDIFPDASIPPVEAVLLIFALSAVSPADHKTALRNIHSVLSEGGVVLFRDYGQCDMTMYRHAVRRAEHLYERTDGTLSYYFSLEYIESLCQEVGFRVVELKYATVLNRNRKKGIDMRRVFVHAVLQK